MAACARDQRGVQYTQGEVGDGGEVKLMLRNVEPRWQHHFCLSLSHAQSIAFEAWVSRVHKARGGTVPANLSFSEQLHAKELFSRLAVKLEGAARGP